MADGACDRSATGQLVWCSEADGLYRISDPYCDTHATKVAPASTMALYDLTLEQRRPYCQWQGETTPRMMKRLP